MRKYLCFFIVFGLWGCQQHYTPKPRGYFRIDLPEKAYQQYDAGCPFTFEYPLYATIEPVQQTNALSTQRLDSATCWMDVVYPVFNARLHLSYYPISTQTPLRELIEDARKFAFSHSVKASGIEQERIDYPDQRVHGIWYEIQGNVASGLQFFLTDSTKHYLRAALYFNENPRRDSIQPVMDFLEEDMQRLIQSTRWK